jgi:hypothetical protein
MPLPIISPTTSESPFRYVRVLFFSSELPLIDPDGSRAAFDGAPSAVYPCAVLERGKRLGVKSKADETLYERLWRPGRPSPRPAGFSSESGSSSSKDNLREEGAPESEDSMDVRCDGWEEEASEASSSESRVGPGREV